MTCSDDKRIANRWYAHYTVDKHFGIEPNMWYAVKSIINLIESAPCS